MSRDYKWNKLTAKPPELLAVRLKDQVVNYSS